MAANIFEERLKQHSGFFQPVVPYNKEDRLLLFDFTERNTDLTETVLSDTRLFTNYINSKLQEARARYGIGGYGEYRTIYSRSKVFDGEEPRRFHLGIDIWGRPYTKVMAPMDGIVHSFAFNNAYGDYGTTIILTHNLEGMVFHTLYGHLSLNSIKNMRAGDAVRSGDVFAEFGIPFENGQWPPHLHFQIVIDLEGKQGDYPGVCTYSESEKYIANCPDPDIILNMMEQAT
jgi:murein DD-endopeptidase MepM/ murein hydrolase activator NlpD